MLFHLHSKLCSSIISPPFYHIYSKWNLISKVLCKRNSHNLFTWITKSCCLIRNWYWTSYLLRWYLLLIKLDCFSVQLRSSCLVQTVYSFNEIGFIYRPLKSVHSEQWKMGSFSKLDWSAMWDFESMIYSSRTLQYKDFFVPLTAVACLLTGVNGKLKPFKLVVSLLAGQKK